VRIVATRRFRSLTARQLPGKNSTFVLEVFHFRSLNSVGADYFKEPRGQSGILPPSQVLSASPNTQSHGERSRNALPKA
jgi:hypothetical protein